MRTGLFVGRFQPFHNAHLKDVKDALEEVDTLYIGIGSPDESRTQQNPFTIEEREDMIEAALEEAGIIAYKIFTVPDVGDDEKWVETIEQTVKPDIVYTGNDWTERCFKAKGYNVHKIALVEGISATMIRSMIRSGIDWKAMVPGAVAKYIEKNGI